MTSFDRAAHIALVLVALAFPAGAQAAPRIAWVDAAGSAAGSAPGAAFDGDDATAWCGEGSDPWVAMGFLERVAVTDVAFLADGDAKQGKGAREIALSDGRQLIELELEGGEAIEQIHLSRPLRGDRIQFVLRDGDGERRCLRGVELVLQGGVRIGTTRTRKQLRFPEARKPLVGRFEAGPVGAATHVLTLAMNGDFRFRYLALEETDPKKALVVRGQWRYDGKTLRMGRKGARKHPMALTALSAKGFTLGPKTPGKSADARLLGDFRRATAHR